MGNERGTQVSTLWTRDFWEATAERAVRTFAQSLLATLGVAGVGVVDADWGQALSVGAMAAVLSVLTSVAASRVDPVGPSLSVETLPAPEIGGK